VRDKPVTSPLPPPPRGEEGVGLGSLTLSSGQYALPTQPCSQANLGTYGMIRISDGLVAASIRTSCPCRQFVFVMSRSLLHSSFLRESGAMAHR
jgi:hypothetical protein